MPKSHVVPSGKRHCEPFGGSAFGHSAFWRDPRSSPPSGVVVAVVLLSPQAPANVAAADPMTSSRASWGARTREEGDTRRE